MRRVDAKWKDEEGSWQECAKHGGRLVVIDK